MQYPNFKYEKLVWKRGFKAIAGIDEVGKGCFAGPVVAAAVVFDKNTISTFKGETLQGEQKIIINDSKKLGAKQRERADKWIRENAASFGLGSASVAQINRLGIKKASEIAFRKAIQDAQSKVGLVDFLLIDAFYIPYVKGLRRKNQKPIVKGDSLSVSIAAASIVAKVYRDKLMEKLGKNPKYRKYGWAKNKGYGTKEHQTAIKKHGTTRLHRKLWVQSWMKNSKITEI